MFNQLVVDIFQDNCYIGEYHAIRSAVLHDIIGFTAVFPYSKPIGDPRELIVVFFYIFLV